MPDQTLLAAIATGELIKQVNTERSFYDDFRLNPALDQLIVARTGAAKVANSSLLMAGGDKAGARTRLTEGRGKLDELLRQGHAYLKGLPALDVPQAEVDDALESYGWESGLLGDLESPTRLEMLATQAATATPELDPAARYPAGLLTRIANWLGIVQANTMIAAGGSIENLTAAKDAAREALLAAIGRVRFFYCSASDERDQTPELAVGFLLMGLGCFGFPGTLGFVAVEVLVDGALNVNLSVGIAMVAVAALNGIAVVRVYLLLFTGTRHRSAIPLPVTVNERSAVLLLSALILGGGLAPQYLLADRRAAVKSLAYPPPAPAQNR